MYRSFNPATGRGGITGAVCEAEWGNSKLKSSNKQKVLLNYV